jgi:hypothetical protein
VTRTTRPYLRHGHRGNAPSAVTTEPERKCPAFFLMDVAWLAYGMWYRDPVGDECG